jgi:hypothetical protein
MCVWPVFLRPLLLRQWSTKGMKMSEMSKGRGMLLTSCAFASILALINCSDLTVYVAQFN